MIEKNCLICGSEVLVHGQGFVLKKYHAKFLKCINCGLVFANNPEWLEEAYVRPINISDTGYVARNIWARDVTSTFVELYINSCGTFLDFGAGYGLFVRLMRDIGYNFLAYDKHNTNLFAQGFEETAECSSYQLVTAFEVLEHLEDPAELLINIQEKSGMVLFTTSLLPNPTPSLTEWIYFGLSHGQHITFYTLKSLKILGERFGYTLISNNKNLHLWTRYSIKKNCLVLIDQYWPKFRAKLKRNKRIPLFKQDNRFIEKKVELGLL